MTGALIDKVEIVDYGDLAGPGDDAHIVAVHGGGLTGWYGPVATAPATLVERCLAPVVVEAPVEDHLGLQARIQRVLRTQAGVLMSWAIGALDCAVWDLHGRVEGRSVAELLAPAATRQSVPAYASWLRLDVRHPSSADTIHEVAEDGWLFTKWGLRRTAHLDIADEVAQLTDLARRTSEAAGAAVALDALGTWDAALTRAFARHVGPRVLTWLEEPLPGYDLDSYAALAACRLPLALGEHVRAGDDADGLLRRARPLVFTLDVVGCGGLTRAADLIKEAAGAGVPVYPHGRSLVPALHLAAAYPEMVPAVEYQVQWQPRRQRLFNESLRPESGRFARPAGPGLGNVPRRS